MLKSLAPKLIIGGLGIGSITAGTIYAFLPDKQDSILDKQDKVSPTSTSIKDKLGDKLLDVESEDNTKWKARADILASDSTANLSSELAKIKQDGDTDGSKVKGWCKDNIKKDFISNENSLFQEIRKYCTYHIKDKVGVTVEVTWTNGKNNQKLKDISGEAENKLSQAMKNIKAKLVAGGNSDNDNALKTWCLTTYEKPFEKEDSQEFKDVKEYCAVIPQQ